jgi:hypothetical protein
MSARANQPPAAFFFRAGERKAAVADRAEEHSSSVANGSWDCVFSEGNLCEKFREAAELILVPLLVLVLLLAQSRVEYVGGTLPAVASGAGGSMELSDSRYFAFYTKGTQVRVPYDRINLLEYGQKVDRRLLMAVVISPMFLLAKSRKHFLTVGYTDDDGRQQAMVFRVDKNGIRAALVGLEARTGQKVQYQDPEARKAGKG